jgi:hypothetical protein
MKIELNNLIENIDSIHVEKVFDFFEKSEEVFLVKYDGIRDLNKYTIMILGRESRFETIRYEGMNLKEGLFYILSEYSKIII